MTTFKESAYNFPVTHKEGDYIYNLYTGAIIKTPRKGLDFKKLSEVELELLEKKGFIVDSAVDESKRAEFSHLASRFSSRALGLVLHTTFECNFSCPYCYEKKVDRNLFMSEELVDKIVDFSESNIQRNKIRSVSLAYIGGEPLARPDIIRRFLTKMDLLKTKHGVSLSNALITNGYFLEENIAGLEMEKYFNFIQVSVDGFEASHDKTRHTADGGGSFEKILKGIIAAERKNIKVAVRYNLLKNNRVDAEKLIDLMSRLKLKATLGFGHVKNYGSAGLCGSLKCMSRPEYSAEDLKLIKYAAARDIKVSLLPRMAYNNCCADNVNSYAIDPRGDMYKCWNEVGQKEQSFGNINDCVDGKPALSKEANYYKYILENPFRGGCAKCKYVPVCMGGCPYERSKGEAACSKYKTQLPDLLGLYLEKKI